MNFEEIRFLNELFRQTIENNLSWSLSTNIPRVLFNQSEITIASCYESNVLKNNQRLYLFRYRVPEYDGEHDRYFYVEKIRVAQVFYDQVSWQSNSDSDPIYNLFNYVSSQFSGINDLFR